MWSDDDVIAVTVVRSTSLSTTLTAVDCAAVTSLAVKVWTVIQSAATARVTLTEKVEDVNAVTQVSFLLLLSISFFSMDTVTARGSTATGHIC